MNLTIKNKILFGLFLILFLFILASYLVTVRIDSIKAHILAVNSLYIPSFKTIEFLKSINETRGVKDVSSFSNEDFEDIFKHFSRFLSSEDGIYVTKQIEKLIEDYHSLTKITSKTTEDLNLKLLRIKASLTQYNSFSKNIIGMIKENKFTLPQAINRFLVLKKQFDESVNIFEKTINRRMQIGLLTAEKDGKDIIISLTIFIITMSIIGLTIFLITSSSLKPLDDLYQGVKRIGAGDFNYKIQIKKSKLTCFFEKYFPLIQSKGELETLADHFNHMSASIQTYTTELRRSERLATIGKISSEITHEIRNPLNSIGLNLSLLEDELSNKEAKEIFNSINNEINRLSSVTESYLNYIKPVTVAFTNESINEIIWNVYDLFKNETERKKIVFNINIPSENIILPLDKNLFTQILINLVKNSIDALSSSNPIDSPKISITITQNKKNYVLTVSDNGPGIEKNDMDKIFLPFYSRKPHGTGLGLGIVYEIVRKHDGTLNCSSGFKNHEKNERETSFTITLPQKSIEV